jgi:(R,R)-butanediol dehydrogenase / meso-butanediol dehydrogenase / diacetyl reductase
MRSASYVGEGKISVATYDAAPPGPGEVQIGVAYTGLCGTDIHILHGSMDERVSKPLTFGHEMSGTILSLGHGVEGWKVGQNVTVMPLDWDNTCPACLAGNQHICQNLNFIGIDSPGSLQTNWNVPAKTLVALPDGLDLKHAALVEPVAVAVHDVRRANVQPGQKAAVIGGGPIGVLVATVAKHFGADVVVIEVDAGRRAQVENLGFEVIDPISQNQVDVVESWTNGVGADVVFEVSGAAAAVLGATSLAKVRGILVVVAIHPKPREIDLQRVFWRELSILGARVYQKQDFETAVDLIAERVIPSEVLISKVVDLTDIKAAFEELSSGRAMKVLVDVAGLK